MNKNVVIEEKEFDPITYTGEKWKIFHKFRRARHLESQSDIPLLGDEIAEKMLKQEHNSSNDFKYKANIFEKGNLNNQIGMLFFSYIKENSKSYNGNELNCNGRIMLLKPYRRKGYGKRLVERLVELAKEHQKTMLKCYAFEEDGKLFLKAINAPKSSVGIDNRLKIADLDWIRLRKWEEEGKKNSINTKIIFFKQIPDEIIKNYSRVYTELWNQQPYDNLDMGDTVFTPKRLRNREKDYSATGGSFRIAITIESNSEISGITEIVNFPSRETFLAQGLTGVQKKFRGRGLGKWLKAAMLLRVQDEFPKVKYVMTGNANSNAPMLSINNRLGFKIHKETIYSQIPITELEEYLSKNTISIERNNTLVKRIPVV
jgi:GNAT superfamily N-acetyltransferase